MPPKEKSVKKSVTFPAMKKAALKEIENCDGFVLITDSKTIIGNRTLGDLMIAELLLKAKITESM